MLTSELLLLHLFDFLETDQHFKTLENLIFKSSFKRTFQLSYNLETYLNNIKI